jgi:hypothetical protein
MLIRRILREVIFNPTVRGQLNGRFWVEGHGLLTKAFTLLSDCAKLAVDLSGFEHLESRIEAWWRF